MPPSMRDFRYASGRHRTRRRYNTGPGYWSVFSRGFDCVYKLKHSAAAKQLLQGVVCLLWLLSPTCAAQGWYTHDDSITNGSISCHYMNSDRQLGRLCTAKQAVFYRIQQEPGQIVDMLVGALLQKLGHDACELGQVAVFANWLHVQQCTSAHTQVYTFAQPTADCKLFVNH